MACTYLFWQENDPQSNSSPQKLEDLTNSENPTQGYRDDDHNTSTGIPDNDSLITSKHSAHIEYNKALSMSSISTRGPAVVNSEPQVSLILKEDAVSNY